MEPNALTIPPGYEIWGPPLAHYAVVADPEDADWVTVIHPLGPLTKHESAAACRKHYQEQRR